MRKCKRKKGKRRVQINFCFLLRCEWEQINQRCALIGGAIVLVIALICAWVSGSPVYARHLLCLPACMPASLVLFMLGGLLYFVLGWGIAALCASASHAQIRDRLSGIACLIAAALFRMTWYPLFFGTFSSALALIALCCAIFLCLCAARSLFGIHKIGALTACIQLPWLIWLLVATGGVLLLN